MIYPATDLNISKAAELIRLGSLVSFPTETVYGLGADALNQAAVEKIFELKGRPQSNPLIVHISDISQIELVAKTNDKIKKQIEILKCFWPGPLSLVLPKSENIPDNVSAGLQTVAVRIPRNPVAIKLIEKSNTPLAAPSANPSNYVSPTSAGHVEESFGFKAPLILDGGSTEIGIESTVLSLVDDIPRLLRPGAVTLEELQEKIGEVKVNYKSNSEIISPGMLPTHYAPRTRVEFISEVDLSSLPARVGLILFSNSVNVPKSPSIISIRRLSGDSNSKEIASKLFSALREMDSKGLNLILVDTCSKVGLGRAIMDRLERATND